jgi:hypothetical protein
VSLVGLLAAILIVLGLIGGVRVAVWLAFRWLGNKDDGTG